MVVQAACTAAQAPAVLARIREAGSYHTMADPYAPRVPSAAQWSRALNAPHASRVPATASSKSHRGSHAAVIGGSIGAGVGALVLVALAFAMLLQRRRVQLQRKLQADVCALDRNDGAGAERWLLTSSGRSAKGAHAAAYVSGDGMHKVHDNVMSSLGMRSNDTGYTPSSSRPPVIIDSFATLRRIAGPAHGSAALARGTINATFLSKSAGFTVEAPRIYDDSTPMRERLLDAIEEYTDAQPPQPFAWRYMLKREFVDGGQALVNFARDTGEGFYQYAIKVGGCSFT